MSGKPYTMRELKTIVDYLTQQKAFSEIKGRKMWMDFANSNLTTRTWQSLKETFLKRILPDIHNPYYKLTREEILSFRQGIDIQAKEKMNKLEIQTISDDSDKSIDANKEKEKTNIETESAKSTSEANPSKSDGEDTSKVLEKNNESTKKPDPTSKDTEAENNKSDENEPESSKPVVQQSTRKSLNESLRDITYNHPLAPLLQDVINDFETESDDSDKEPKMEIVEDSNKSVDDGNESKSPQGDDSPVNMAVTDVAKNAKGLSAEVVEEVLLSEIQDSGNIKTKSLTLKKSQKMINEDKSNKTQEVILILSEKDGDNDNTEIDVETNSNEEKEKSSTQQQNKDTQNTSADTLIPNNQECLGKSSMSNEKSQGQKDEHYVNVSRKRASSEETLVLEQKKRKNDKFDELLKEGHGDDKQNGMAKDREKDNVTISKKVNITTKKKTSREKSYENPCLKSVNLFTDKFRQSKLDDSDSSDPINSTTNRVSKENMYNIKTSVLNKDVLVLQSHSDTESHTDLSPKKNKLEAKLSKMQRKKALANVFGFSSGTVTSSRKTKLSLKKSSPHQKYNDSGSRSSDWTSESESEDFVSPPRARRNRPTKKYLKPKSARVLSLEEEGGLFVMYGKRIYPLVKDGKMVKNYLTYKPNRDSDLEEDRYWKNKYAEEKKKTDQLKKLLEETKKTESDTMPSPILPPPRNINRHTNIQNTSHKEVQVQETPSNEQVDKTMKIKLTRNNEEVYLEGRWSQIETALKHVVNIIDTKPPEENTKKISLNMPETKQSMVISSGESTPVAFDPVTHAKVNKIESEIFKEIEERDKLENPKGSEPSKSPGSNVTRRGRGRPRNSSTTAGPSPAKKSRLSEDRTPRTSVSETKESLDKSKSRKSDESKNKNKVEKKNDDSKTKQKNTPKKSPKKSKPVSSSDEEVVTARKTRSSIGKLRRRSRNISYDESNVRYMLANKLRSTRTSIKKTRSSKRR